ncbi:hypothetical protein DFR33_109178 [Bradymonas sediminis]|uniref:Uncharacterized protein n=2 Tax=Bradymonas sediminis TaxID=1548548 RepID=A0A2Z4FJ28_9DELT|nr:hypothetical protein DN745_06615 [Bradymonas sediminis]TDP64514.1 hypothetical protein DFR33_109178 [Bradymonas sediminis]
MGNPMQLRTSYARSLRALCASLLLLVAVGLAGGCSFIFDFEECRTSDDCVAFDDAENKQFFVCSNAKKCVLEVARECRQDADCTDAAAPICAAAGKCVAE